MVTNLLPLSIISNQWKLLTFQYNVYAYIKLSLIDNLVVTQKEVLSDRWSIQRLIKENQRGRERERKKTWMIEVAKSCHQVTWTQKREKKEKTRVNFLITKFSNVNS